MALGEKLNKLTHTLEEQKTQNKKLLEDADLAPVRQNIKRLKTKKHILELIEGTLSHNPDISNRASTLDVGMKEYAEKKNETAGQEKKRITELFEAHKESLSTIGIESVEDLIAHPEYQGEEEVIEHQKAEEELNLLMQSDTKLVKRLIELGVPVDEGNFSYDSTLVLIKAELENIERELESEKLKTPEGRDEVVEKLGTRLEKQTPGMTFSKSSKDGGITFDVDSFESGSSATLYLAREKKDFQSIAYTRLATASYKDLETKYGAEIARQALVKSYQKKLHEALLHLDKQNENVFLIGQKLKDVHLESVPDAHRAIGEYNKKVSEANRVLMDRSEELNEKGVDFSPTYATGYGGKYEDFFSLTESTQKNLSVTDALENPDRFPPVYDYQKLTGLIQRRTQDIQEFIESVKKLETAEDVDAFVRGSKSYVSLLHKKQMRSNPSEEAGFTFSKTGYVDAYQISLDNLPKEFKSLSKAENYVEGKIQSFTDMESKIMEVIELGIDIQEIGAELQKKLDETNFARAIGYVEQQISRIESNKKEAQMFLGHLIEHENKFKDSQNLELSGRVLVDHQREKERNDLYNKLYSDEFQTLDKKLTKTGGLKNYVQYLTNELQELEQKKPKLFTGGWEKAVTELKVLLADSTSLLEQSEKKYKEINGSSNDTLEIEQHSDLAKVFEKVTIKGTPSEVFGRIREEIHKALSVEAPKEVLSLYEKYESLQRKLEESEK